MCLESNQVLVGYITKLYDTAELADFMCKTLLQIELFVAGLVQHFSFGGMQSAFHNQEQ